MDPKFYLNRDFTCGCGAGFYQVVVVPPKRCWMREPDFGIKLDERERFCGVLCSNNHFTEDGDAQWNITNGNQNGNRGRRYIRAMTDSFTENPFGFQEEFFLCWTDEVVNRMIGEGYLDPSNEDVMELKTNAYDPSIIYEDYNMNLAATYEMREQNYNHDERGEGTGSEISTKWATDSNFTSVSAVLKWKDRNPEKPIPRKKAPQKGRPAKVPAPEALEALVEETLTGVSGGRLVAENEEIQNQEFDDEISMYPSSFPHYEPNMTKSSGTQTIVCKVKDSCIQTEEDARIKDLTGQIDSLKKELLSLSENKEKSLFSNISNWLKDKVEVHTVITFTLAAIIIFERRRTFPLITILKT